MCILKNCKIGNSSIERVRLKLKTEINFKKRLARTTYRVKK